MITNKIKKVRIKTEAFLSRFLPRSMVLIYHRVADLGRDPQKLSVTPENFERHMDVISKNYHPISLAEMVSDLRNGHVRDRTVVVTFDDGYEDNYLNARPILEKYGIPATIYVSSGYLGMQREFWWDELDRLILGGQDLPHDISIELNGEVRRWSVQKNDNALGKGVDHLAQHNMYMDMCAWFQSLGGEQINDAIQQLRELTGDSGEARQGYVPMSIEQLRSLHNGGLIEIGAHTRSHVNLATQSDEKQKEEIEGSKQDLERILGSNVESFSYPFGTLSHYTNWSVKCVKGAGFSNALANFTGNVTRLSNPYEVPRRMVRNWDRAGFEDVMNQYYSVKRQIYVGRSNMGGNEGCLVSKVDSGSI